MDEDYADSAGHGESGMKLWFFLAPVLPAVLLIALPISFNEMASEPIGFYWNTRQSGPYAKVCLPPKEEAQAIDFGIPDTHGTCPGGHQPLLKQLFAASDHHPILFSAAGFTINGQLLPHTAPVVRAANGKLLQPIPYGIYTHGLFAISTYHPRSYDSRYFGPIDPRSVAGFARPLLVFR
jgi:conjugative transfer signal peptidase TraF